MRLHREKHTHSKTTWKKAARTTTPMLEFCWIGYWLQVVANEKWNSLSQNILKQFKEKIKSCAHDYLKTDNFPHRFLKSFVQMKMLPTMLASRWNSENCHATKLVQCQCISWSSLNSCLDWNTGSLFSPSTVNTLSRVYVSSKARAKPLALCY